MATLPLHMDAAFPCSPNGGNLFPEHERMNWKQVFEVGYVSLLKASPAGDQVHTRADSLRHELHF